MADQVRCPKCGGYKVHTGVSEAGCFLLSFLLLFAGGPALILGIGGVVKGTAEYPDAPYALLAGLMLVGIIVLYLWGSSANAECRICGYKWKLR